MHDINIIVFNARQHNLKNITVSIPLNKITVITGPSGSGKSSLTIDVLFAEGQHRYLESLGFDAVYLLKLRNRPLVEKIKNLPPTIALEQNYRPRNPYSTIATLSALDDLIRLLYVHAGIPHCTNCTNELKTMNIDEIIESIFLNFYDNYVYILVKIIKLTGLEEAINALKAQGFSRFLVNSKVININKQDIDYSSINDIYVIIDRLLINKENRTRLADSVSIALRMGDGVFVVTNESLNSKRHYSEKNICPYCMTPFPEINTRLFTREIYSCEACGGESNSCPKCLGSGLSSFALNILFDGISYPNIFNHTLKSLFNIISSLSDKEEAISRIKGSLLSRLEILLSLHLGYLTLNRPIVSLSRGELQRLRLGIQLGKELTGILYILDEPTLGLHRREQESLWDALVQLKDQGNTIVIVEHNLDFIIRADYVIELGPEGGENGGYLIFQGTPRELKKCETSITAKYIRGDRKLARNRRKNLNSWLILKDLQKHNLKIPELKIPLNALVCVCGPSGSGKTTLVFDEILNKIQEGKFEISGEIKSGSFYPISIDQLPLSTSTSSILATYIEIFDPIRTLFAMTPDAKARGVKAGFFSLNKKGGRCEACQGLGFKMVNLEFLPPVKTLCSHCLGKRYTKDALEIRFKGKNISEVLEMDVKEAREFFNRHTEIRLPLDTLCELGLHYLKLGQLTNTLSGGEAQRLKLSKELYKTKDDRHEILLLDEPTQGLHAVDIDPLLELLDRLIDKGNSVIMIEHQEEILRLADYVIELGYGGGDEGGLVVFEGSY